jgi:IclR family acetate operon transcriptional repressor
MLKLHLREIVARGYALDDGENDPGVRCLSAPVFAASGEPVGCIGVDGPSVRITETKIQAIAGQVVAAAERLTRTISGLEQPTLQAASA